MLPVIIDLDKDICNDCKYFDSDVVSKYSDNLLYDCAVSCKHSASCRSAYLKGLLKGKAENSNDT